MGGDPREFRLRPLAAALSLLATTPLIVGGAVVLMLSGGAPFPIALGGFLFVSGVYIAIRVPFLHVRYDDDSVRVVGVLWSRTISRSSIQAVSTDIERPSINWVTAGGARIDTPLAVLKISSSSLVPLAARRARANFLAQLERWAVYEDLPDPPGGAVPPMTRGFRRNWRARNRPPIRRSDPFWDIAGWTAPILAFFAVLSAFGIVRRSPPMDVEASAALIIVEASIIVVLFGAVMLRRARGILPDRYPRAMLAWTGLAVVAAAVTIWIRDGAGAPRASAWPIVVCITAAALSFVLLSTGPKRTRSVDEESD